MKSLIKVKTTDVVLKMNFNYDNLYARLRAALKNEVDIFAKINFLGPNISWSVQDDTRNYKSLDAASAAEKMDIVAKLALLQTAIKSKLSVQKDFVQYLDVLFEVPDESFIFFSDDPEHKIVLAGWGCRRAHTVNTQGGTLAMLLGNSDEAPMQQVSLKIIQKSGGLATGRFAYDMEAEHQEFVVSPDGIKEIGLLPVGMCFHVTDLQTNHKKGFVVTEGLSVYVFEVESTGQKESGYEYGNSLNEEKENINTNENSNDSEKKEVAGFKFTGSNKVPIQETEIRILSATSSPVAGQRIRIDCLQASDTFYTDNDGVVPVGSVPVGTGIEVVVGSSEDKHSVVVESGKKTYNIVCSSIKSISPVISLLDSSEMLVFGTEIRVLKAGEETVYNSGSDGMIVLPSMKEGEHFIVIEKKNPNNSVEFIASSKQPGGIYTFHLQDQKESDIRIIVTDQSSSPVKACSVTLSLLDAEVSEETGDNGVAVFKAHNFKGEAEIPARFKIAGKDFIYRTIKYTPDQADYTIRLNVKKKRKIVPWVLGVIGTLFVVFGTYEVYKWVRTPSVDTLSKGVVFVRTVHRQYACLKDKSGNVVKTFYFNWHDSEFDYIFDHYLFVDKEDISMLVGSGTGFFISNTGKIVTNKHVACPDLPSKDQVIERLSQARDFLYKKYEAGQMTKEDVSLYKTLSNYVADVSNYKVEVGQDVIDVSVAYYKSIVEWKDLLNSDNFHSCIVEKSGKSEDEDDLSIIQVKNIGTVPKDVHVFTIPQKDPITENDRGKDIRLIGYNAGLDLANGENGITPQVTKGSIATILNKYELTYDSVSLGGSSGSPIIDNKGRLVSINHAGIRGEFKMGIRLVHLINLVNSEDGENN